MADNNVLNNDKENSDGKDIVNDGDETDLENKKNTACLEQYTSKLTYSICETNVD